MMFGTTQRLDQIFNEDTYVMNVIISSIRSALKNLPFRKNAFISTSEQ